VRVARVSAVKADSHHHARHVKTFLCRVRFGCVNGFPTTRDCRRQKIWSLNTFRARPNSHRHTRHDTDRTVLRGCVNWVGPSARQVRSASECVGRRSATAGRTDAKRICQVVGPTQFTPPHQTRLSRLPVDRCRRDADRQLRLTAHAQRRCTPRKM